MGRVGDTRVRGTLRRSTALWLGLGLLAAGVALGAVIFARGDAPFPVDVWWNSLLAADRSDVGLAVSFAMNWLGGGWFSILGFPVLVVIALALLQRPWSLAFFVASEVISVALVQVLKHTFGRARPEDILVVSDFGSFPSGHVANAATLAVALYVLFPRLWVAIVGAAWVVLMAFSRTYLGAHWPSDTLGGALVGAAAVLLVYAVVADRMRTEIGPRQTDATASLG